MEFKRYNPIGIEEIELVNKVLESGILSGFVGTWSPKFFGGPYVQEFEKKFSKYFGVKNAITFNSWTSGLIAAVGAIGTEPGDEIIVTPWTMSASAIAILHWNAIPIFADIDPETYCIDPESIESKITERTKAIISVDLFGQSANTEKLMVLSEKYNIKLISDSAQAPGAMRNGKYAGTSAHIGGFSLNYHKHIHTGEGGVLVTNDDELANRVRLIRNHAESVVGDAGIEDITNMVGYNFRMNEIEAAIGISQLDKLSSIVNKRQEDINELEKRLSKLLGLILPKVDKGNTHVYYTYPFQLDRKIIKSSKFQVAELLTKAGVPNISTKYGNIHLLPIFQKKIAFGKSGFPWTYTDNGKNINYEKGICPVAENLIDNSFLHFYINDFDLTPGDIDAIASKFEEVWNSIEFK